MASSKEFVTFFLEQFPEQEVTARFMMGEAILYVRGKVVGGIYDNRLLVKPTPTVCARLPQAPWALPYEGAKEMLLVEDVDNVEFLRELFADMYDELPVPKGKSPGKPKV